MSALLRPLFAALFTLSLFAAVLPAAPAGAGICTDEDDDSYCAEDDDCNDGDFFVNPGATELDGCFDTIDNDCDGNIDADDGECDDYDGDSYTIADGDCNDDDSSVNPGASEVCDNSIDDDCDTDTDLDDSECPDCTDEDDDGFNAEFDDCGARDCDDNDSDVYPGAVEIDNDLDDNCNSFIDEILGAQLQAVGGTVTARVKGGFGGLFRNEIWLFSPGTPVKIGEAADYPTLGTDGPPVVLGPFAPGVELLFGIVTHNTFDNAIDRFYMGPACRNFDNVFHDMIFASGAEQLTVGFEDLRNDTGGEMTNAGVVVESSEVTVFGPTTAVPELCNTIDDDCDGGTDVAPADVGQECDGDFGGTCEGTTTCEAGAPMCVLADDTDSDSDSTPDCADGCPDDLNKTEPGICGCGESDTDGDGDSTPDCNDECPSDPGKIVEGLCGCGLGDDNTDGDSEPDCTDECDTDPTKTLDAGICGCNVAETDSDADGVPNCVDNGQDLAVTGIKQGGLLTLTAGGVAMINRKVIVKIQNRGPQALTFTSAMQLDSVVDLVADSLGACLDPAVTMAAPKKLPLVIKSKAKKKVTFFVSVACANDAESGAGNEDYSLSASVDLSAMGQPDTHPADDVCPRSVTPPFVIDPNPDGKIKDKGCGAKLPDKTFGGPVLLDVVLK